MFAKFVERLRSTPDGDGSLLDHSLLVYGSGMSDGNGHTGSPLPHVVVGRRCPDASRAIGTSSRRRARRWRTCCLAIAQKCGVEQERFGVSKGAVEI